MGRWSKHDLVSTIVTLILLFPIVLASSPGTGIVLRIRLANGSMERVQVPPGAEESMTLNNVLEAFSLEDGSSIQVGTDKRSLDSSNTLAVLGIKHGSLITISAPKDNTSAQKPSESRFSQMKRSSELWSPFPDLSKDYEHALLKTKTRRSSQKGMSYGDIAQLQSNLHLVEAQQEGPLKRVYMCRLSAERFHANGFTKATKAGTNGSISVRIGLLFGTIQTERVEMKPRRARTSLSSQVSDDEYCTVAKVQAVWEPSGQQSQISQSCYDDAIAQQLLDSNPRVVAIAGHLGLVPVGWIFTYTDNRHQDEDALPMFGVDVRTGASLQISNMRALGRSEGSKFVTLAMDANTGATEAFQLSDVSVQMVAEGMLLETAKGKSGRHVSTKHPVLVDGKETKTLDSVMCLVNTAMLSHVGSFAGRSSSSAVKKSGGLTTKTKKAILGALEDNRKLLELLSDMNVLVALDQSLGEPDSEELCKLVKKWARGQKVGTVVGNTLKMTLRSILET